METLQSGGLERLMEVGLGYSERTDEKAALEEALSQAVQTSGVPSFFFLFITPQYNPHRILEALREAFPLAKILGCSAEGVVVGRRLLSRGIALLALAVPGLRAFTVSPPFEGSDSYALGELVGREVQRTSLGEGTLVILPDPALEVPLFLQGLYNVLGPRFLYLGGGTGAFRFTEQGVNLGPVSVGVFEGIAFSSAADHGWSPTRELLVVTKTRGREVVEIDGIPPFEAYCERVGDFSREDLPWVGTLYPLGFPGIFGDFLIRDPAYFTPDGAMGFVGASIPEGAVGYLMRGEKESLLAAAARASQKAICVGNPLFALVFDCVSRALVLGEAFEEELKIVDDTLGGLPCLGFLSVGEIHPRGRAPLFRNKTVVVAVAGRKRARERFLSVCDASSEVELAILHEISSLSFPGSYQEFFREVVERAVRLFGVQRMAFLWRRDQELQLAASWGFSDPAEVQKEMASPKEHQRIFLLGEQEAPSVLFFEAPYPLRRREHRLYALFARKVEDVLRFARHLEEQKQRLRELEHLSLTDELTGIYNRRGFLVLAEHALLVAQREGKEAGVLFLDLDNLKWINDQFGHEEGDRAIREFGRIIQKVFRKSDVIARIGGDEFAVLLSGVKNANLQRILHRLTQLVEEWNSRNQCSYRLSFSAGWAPFLPSQPQKIRELLSFADARMYDEKRKKRGGNSLTPS
ncbi:sensor domain-containing diguanylate cyclase [Candidatus Caldatribacterium saccharofermentans]|uniref:sensor domain-containing diguanylate cyclase n=1 Tax=Candidatus Caldatribacterium saccharofermentans TaxID=1454753 RepID=UPI003D0798A6